MSESSRVPMPEPDPSSGPSNLSRSGESDEKGDVSPLPSAHQDAVHRLRAKVERAATLLNRLREENERLRQKIEELEGRPAIPDGNTILALDEEPEVLRDRISAFIEALDTYFEDDASMEKDLSAEGTPA